jgi:hypothetical protein
MVSELPFPNGMIDLTTISIVDLQSATHMKGVDHP